MEKFFICLANSKKYNQRCIAGIELRKSSREGYKYDIVRNGDNPAWIRPVSHSEHGEVSSELVDHINILDIVKINLTAVVPRGYQSENVLFDNRRLQVVERIDKDRTLVDKLVTVNTTTLFGNRENAVHINDIDRLNHSLVLIKPTNVHIYKTTGFRMNPQIRAGFEYGKDRYDLPVTDIDFEKRFNQDPSDLSAVTHLYFAVSLGTEFNQQHYKLIAGILYF
jgi:hypothetical protein